MSQNHSPSALEGMMSPHRSNFYQRHSVGIMAILVFLLPMVVVGAIKAKANNRNDVKGWLPADYPETRTYRFFRQNFQGEEFILVSWEGCTMGDPRLEMLARKLLPPPEEASRIERPLYFKTAQTGPRAVERMGQDPLNLDREESFSRLTGALIGPPPPGVEAGSAADDLDQRKTCLVLTLADVARANLHGAIDEIRKVATKMKAGGQKVRPSLIVQELAKQNVLVVPAQVSMVLKRMGFKPLRKRKKRVGGESNAKVPAKASKASSLGIEDLLAAKKAVEAFGGSDRAIEAIRALKRLED